MTASAQIREDTQSHMEHDHAHETHAEDSPTDRKGHDREGHERTTSDPAGNNNAEEGGGHDHSTDHGQSEGSVWASLGKLHVLTVHFPVALLLLAGVLELIGMVTRGSGLQAVARVNFAVGACAALIAAPLGWIMAAHSTYGEELAANLFNHRWLGVTVATLSLCGLLGLAWGRKKGPEGIHVYRTVCIVLLILIPLTAHFGGTLVFGKGYFPY